MTKRIYLLWMLLAVCLCGRADTLSAVDSLLTLYGQSKGKARMEKGEELLKIYADYPVFFHESPTITSAMSDSEVDLIVWYATDRFYTVVAYYAEALEYNGRALPLLSDTDMPDRPTEAPTQQQDFYATLLCDRSYCLFKTSDYDNAVETSKKALEVCRQTGNMVQLARAYLYIALVNHALQNHDEAIAQVQNAIKTNEQLGDDGQLHNALGIACEIFGSARQLDKAVEYGQRAVEMARQIGYQSGVANHLLQLSYVYDRKGDYQQGIDAADEAIAIIKAGEPLDRNQLALALEYKSWNLIDIGRHRQAVDALNEAISLQQELGNKHAAWNDYRTLSEALEPNNPHAAVEALRTYIRMGDSIYSEQLKELTSRANAEFQNDELREENAENQRQNRIILWTSLIVVVMLITAIASLWFAFRQKKRSNEALRRLTEARENFFTNVTHEFRTPLTVILGAARELKASDEVLGASIERQGQQLLTLVNQMLDISKVKSSLGHQPQTQGDLSAYVAMVVEHHQELARQKGLTLDYTTDKGGIETVYVVDYIQKVAGNLLSNAIKFTPEGGHIKVELHRLDDHIQLCVSDTGTGIAAKDLPHIFEPFYRADDSGSMGSGIGLALVKQIIDALGGTIEVESKVGQGTTFKVEYWPAAKKAGSTAPESPAPVANAMPATQTPPTLPFQAATRASSDAPRLLIVEDNPDVAALIGRQLDDNYEVTIAPDGAKGIEKARELMPDLIITDLMMPGTDGLQLCRTIRADEVTSHIPIIMVTAKATEEDRIQGIEAGADAYLYKPFNAEELRVRVEKLLELREQLRRKFSLTDAPKHEEEEPAPTPFATPSANFINTVRQTVIDLMPKHQSDVEHVASEMNLSTFQLRSKLTAITGVTPKKYILSVRLDVARQMLDDYPERTVADVAERCGFYDKSHFIKNFRETFGVNPGEYTKQNAEN